MPILYLLCGMPFSGKTTLGKTICNQLDFAYISLDEINEARGLCGGEGISIAEWEKTHSLAMEQLRILMRSSQDIVLDDTNCFRWLRDRFRNLATQYNYQTKIIFLDISPIEIWQRRSNNEETTKRHTVKSEIIEQMVKTFELPQEDEHIIRYSGQKPIEEWIMNHLKSTQGW